MSLLALLHVVLSDFPPTTHISVNAGDDPGHTLIRALSSIRGEDLHFKNAHTGSDHVHTPDDLPQSMKKSLDDLKIPPLDGVKYDLKSRKISIEVLSLAPPGTDSRLSRAVVTPEHESRVSSVRAMLDAASKILETPLHVNSDTYPYRSRKPGKQGYGLRTMFIVEPDYLIAHGDHFHRSSDMEEHAGRVLIILIAALVLSQYAVKYAERAYPKAYEIFQTASLWLLPAGLAVRAGFYRFLCVWLIFLAAHVAILIIARRSAQWPEAPRMVYLLFLHLHRICFVVGVAGASALIAAFACLWLVVIFTPPVVMHAATAAAPPPPGWSETILLAGAHALFYGVYLGIVCRDTAHLVTGDLLNRLHARRGFAAGSGALQNAHSDTCSICLRALGADAAEIESLRVARPGLDAAPPAPALSARLGSLMSSMWALTGQKTADEPSDDEVQPLRGEIGAEQTYALKCGHIFHDACLRGHLLVGKHDTCPSCGERCALKDRFTTPWERFAAAHSGGLDLVRRVLVWNPLMLLVMDRALVIFY